MTDSIQSMRRRHSVRRYSSTPLTADEVACLRRAAESTVALDESVPVRLSLVPYGDIGRRQSVASVPLYNAAPWYLVFACADVPGRMEEVGFRGEQVVIAASSLMLDTCWVAGTFDPRAVAAACHLDSDDVIAITPIGRGETGPLHSVTTALSKPLAMRAGRRKALSEFVFAGRWGTPAEQTRTPPPVWQAMEMARIAPSWANTQPWAFLLVEDVLWAFADTRPQRGNNVPTKPYARLDGGIAMAHVHLTLCQHGYSTLWRRPPAPPPPSLAVPSHYVPLAWCAIA